MAVRSPLCKSRKGGFKDMNEQELLTSFFKVCLRHLPAQFSYSSSPVTSRSKAVIPKLGISPALIEDICVGKP